MKTPIESPKLPNDESPSAVKDGRRRFVRGVGVAVPVLMTVKSPSTLAGQCFSPSASASINLLHSRTNRPPDGLCGGVSPGIWLQAATPLGNGGPHPNLYYWTQAGVSPDKLFSQVFSGGPKDSLYSGKTLKQVLAMAGTTDPQQFGAHMVAAFLNYKSVRVPAAVLDGSDLSAMWLLAGGSSCGLGYYQPTPGVCWDIDQIKQYLTTTWS